MIDISGFNYELPPDKIALHPAEPRDSSRLLVYSHGKISSSLFSSLPDYMEDGCMMVLNNTRVIRARLQFRKQGGAAIEIFCLEPCKEEINTGLSRSSPASWVCLIGNKKKWKSGPLNKVIYTNQGEIKLVARMDGEKDDAFIVKFEWEPAHVTFSEVLDGTGVVPLPPYINRAPEENDKNAYQTIYANHNGSVAAPTAGLHFTESTFRKLLQKNIILRYVTLHVGAGTFKPVSGNDVRQHVMHAEEILMDKKLIEDLLLNMERKIIAVGTTSVRTLESIYWFGVDLSKNGNAEFSIDQWQPYRGNRQPPLSRQQALENILLYMQKNLLDQITGKTDMIIVPGYKFRMTDGIITNFHLPKSTLLLLIAAFLGDDWKKIYHYALSHDFRFLSYGDCCLFT